MTRGNEGRGRRARRAIGSAVLLVAASVAVLPADAPAARSAETLLSVSPAETLGSKPIVVSWHTDRAPRADRKYLIEVQIDGVGPRCVSFAQAEIEPSWKKGATVTATLRANTTKRKAWWCTGKGAVRVGAYSGAFTTRLARTLFEVRNDPKSPTPIGPLGMPVRIDLLAGSALTVKVPGRPDRSAPLSGTLRGFLPGTFRPLSDLRHEDITGTLTVAGLPPDPLCRYNARPTTTSFDSVRATSLVLMASGAGYLTLVPSEDLLGVIGCEGVPPAAARALVLTGKVGPAGLVEFRMSGNIGDVQLSDGALATISLALVVKIDLSGK